MAFHRILLTGIIASARRFNRIEFEIVEDDGTLTPVIYPRSRRGEDDQSLAVEDSIFQTAVAIYFGAQVPEQRLAIAELYLGKTKESEEGTLPVEGIKSLAPVSNTV